MALSKTVFRLLSMAFLSSVTAHHEAAALDCLKRGKNKGRAKPAKTDPGGEQRRGGKETANHATRIPSGSARA